MKRRKPERSRREERPAIPMVAPFEKPQAGMVKIGKAAKRLGLSVQAIRLYESEGLIISFKSSKGTRWYGPDDLLWIARIQELISEGLNFVGIRRLLAQIPCWALKPCRPEDHAHCSMRFEWRHPCWIAPEKLCPEKLRECYHCPTYRRARDFVNLKSQARIIPLEMESSSPEVP
ncbi:MAG: MerR family transcriptional regulator [Acidobacteriota bacterium]